MDTVDNRGEPGVLTIINFGASTPGSPVFWLLVTGAVLLIFRGRNITRRKELGGISGVMILVVGGSLFTAVVPMRAQVNSQFTGTDISGQLTLVRTVNLRQQAQTLGFQATFAAATTKEQLKAPPKRLRPPFSRQLTALAATVPPVKGLAVTSPGTAGFNALSHLDQRQAFGGNQFSVEPPSQSIAVGNGFVLEGVNNAVQVYNSTGAPVLPAVLASNQVFGLAPAINRLTNDNGVYLTDMRVYFDQTISRWFVIQRSQDNDLAGNPLPQSHLYLAISKTNDPAGDYLIYLMDTTNGSHPGCPCISDYPQVGSDQFGLHISWNQFNAFSLSFVDAAISSFSKAALASGVLHPTAYQFLLPFTTGYEFAIQPSTTPPGASNFLASGGVEYFVSSSARFSGTSGLALWAARNTSSLATPSPNLVLMQVALSSLPYTFPDVATQRAGPLPYGSSVLPSPTPPFLDGGDTRVLSLTYAGARLYLTLQTGVTDENSRFVVGGAYIVVSPIFRGNVLSGSVLNQGYLLVNGNHVLRPSIAVNAQGRGAIAVTLVGADWFPTAALIPFDTFSTPSVLEIGGLGTLPEDGFTGYGDFGVGVARWGDYNTAATAADGSIWMVAQYVGSFPRTPSANWNTYIMRKVF